MAQNQINDFQEILKSTLQEQYNRGVQVGIAAASQVIHKKLNDTSKTLAESIIEVEKFCQISLNNIKGKETNAETNQNISGAEFVQLALKHKVLKGE